MWDSETENGITGAGLEFRERAWKCGLLPSGLTDSKKDRQTQRLNHLIVKKCNGVSGFAFLAGYIK
jgi:hypothetical protein